MQERLVSIVIPVYNGADYVCEAIDSALSQTYDNIEVLVINDGSNDGGKTRECVNKYSDRVRYVEKKNGGVASALNEGIRLMKGEYFTWLSHDDLFDSRKIELQMRAIKDSHYSIAAMNYAFFDNDTRAWVHTRFQELFPINLIQNSVFLLLWGELHFSSLLFHRSHFDRIGLFNENLKTAQDNDFMFRLLRNQKIVFEKKEGSYIRLHSDSGTAKQKTIVDVENYELYKRIKEELTLKEMISIAGESSKVCDKINGIIHSLEPEVEFKLPKKKDNNRKIILVGAGIYGKRLNYELQANGIIPDCFLDSNPYKENRIIDGVLCKRLCKENIPNDSKLIITNKFYANLEKQLLGYGFKADYRKEEVDSLILADRIEELF